jgi:putative oxidoreductase
MHENLPTPDQLSFAMLILRLVVGPIFAFHGFAKITRGGKLEGTAGWFESMGMRPGHVHARVAAFGELATGACITLGFLTTFAGMGLVGLMSVAFWTVHRGRGLLITGNGWEYVAVLGTIGVVLATIGAGDWSLDNAIGVDLNGPAGFIIALAGGVGLAAILLRIAYRPPSRAAAGADAAS